MEKSGKISIYSETGDFDFRIVSNLENADFIIKMDGSIVANLTKVNPLEEVSTFKKGGTIDFEIAVPIFLNQIGMPTHLKGYPYIREAIIMILKDINIINSITGGMYPQIAKKFNTTATNVGRNIKHSINVTCEKGNSKFIRENFKYSFIQNESIPSNVEFLAYVADYLRIFVFEIESDNDLKKEVTKYLVKIGMPANVKGYYYCREAIVMVLNDRDMINSVSKKLYPQLAKKFNSIPSKIERNIMSSIELSSGIQDLNNFNEKKLQISFINSSNGRPSKVEFISQVAEYIRLKNEI